MQKHTLLTVDCAVFNSNGESSMLGYSMAFITLALVKSSGFIHHIMWSKHYSYCRVFHIHRGFQRHFFVQGGSGTLELERFSICSISITMRNENQVSDCRCIHFISFGKPSVWWLYNTTAQEDECGGKTAALHLIWTSRSSLPPCFRKKYPEKKDPLGEYKPYSRWIRSCPVSWMKDLQKVH